MTKGGREGKWASAEERRESKRSRCDRVKQNGGGTKGDEAKGIEAGPDVLSC